MHKDTTLSLVKLASRDKFSIDHVELVTLWHFHRLAAGSVSRRRNIDAVIVVLSLILVEHVSLRASRVIIDETIGKRGFLPIVASEIRHVADHLSIVHGRESAFQHGF